MNIQHFISTMTLEDKISLCTGGDFRHTKAMPQYGIPAIMMSDGPHGLRCQPADADMLGINQGFSPRFLRRYANLGEEITHAVQAYIEDVKTGDFPNEKEQY